MIPHRLGPIGGLAADRPLLSTLTMAFGLTALAAAGAAKAPLSAAGVADLILVVGLLAAAPFVAAAAAPRALIGRVALAALIAGAPIALEAAPATFAAFLSRPAAAGFAALTVLLLTIAPLFGAARRFSFIASLASLLGMAGALGLFAIEGGAIGAVAGSLAALAFAAGAVVGVGVLFDFAALFARGAERRRAAGIAARHAGAPAAFASLAAALAVALFAAFAGSAEALRLGWLAGAAALLAASVSLLAAGAALALRRPSETIAVDENRRRALFRRFWRPMRRLLPPSAALAIVAIAGVAVLASTFVTGEAPVAAIAYATAVAAAAALIFYSIRTGAFIFISVVAGAFLSQWGRGAFGLAPLPPADEAPALALAAILFAQLALVFRDARSPRLNARETTEAAMTDALGRFVTGALAAVAGFYAASLAGAWPGGDEAAAYLGGVALIGLALAPALMTALTHIVRRDLN